MSDTVHALVNVVGSVVIRRDGKYLLVQETKPQVRGLWNIPGGRVEVGDSIERTAVKEVQEETGFEVELVRQLDIWQDSIAYPAAHVFEGRIVGGVMIESNEEIMAVQWYTIDQIRNMKEQLRSTWLLEAIEMVEVQS